MSMPPFDQYAAALQMVVGVMDRSLRMISYEEERRSRDDVLLALNAMRDYMAEQGVNIPAQVVLQIFEQHTGYDVGKAMLATLAKQAMERKTQRIRTNAFDIMESTIKYIETERKKDNGNAA